MRSPASSADPTYGRRRQHRRRTRGPELGAIAAMLGTPLFGWQRLVADVALEVRADGRPFYRTACLQAARQSGKSRALVWPRLLMEVRRPGRQAAYTAQSRELAREKLVELHDALRVTPFAGTVERFVTANGRERIVFRNGSSIRIVTPSEKGGRGATLDLVVIDEAGDVRDSVLQALEPTLATRPAAQLWVVSNAGQPAVSTLLERLRTRGITELGNRAATICWFEWSAPMDADPFDEAAWRQANPSLGLAGGPAVESLREAAQNMELHAFRREHLNQWAAQVPQAVFADRVWNGLAGPVEADRDRVVLGLAVNRERTAATIAAASPGDGDVVVEVVDARPGVDWVVDRVAELAARYDARVVVETGSQAGALIDQLEEAQVVVARYTARDYCRACASFADLVAEGRLTHQGDPRLDAAVAVVTRRQVGDGWCWDQRVDGDITPLVAVTLAARETVVAQPAEPAIW